MIGIGISIGASVITAPARAGGVLAARFPAAVAALDLVTGDRMGPAVLNVSRAGPAHVLTRSDTLAPAAPDTARRDVGGLLIEPAGANLIPSPALQGAGTGTVSMPDATGLATAHLPAAAEIGVFNAVPGTASYTVHAVETRRGAVMMDLEVAADYAGSGPTFQMILRPAGRTHIAAASGDVRTSSLLIEMAETDGALQSVQLQHNWHRADGGYLANHPGAEMAGAIAQGVLVRLDATATAPLDAGKAVPQLRLAAWSGPARTIRRRFWWGVPQHEAGAEATSPMPDGARADETARLTGLPGGTYDIYVTRGDGTVTTYRGETVAGGSWPIPAPGPSGLHRIREIVVMPAGAADP